MMDLFPSSSSSSSSSLLLLLFLLLLLLLLIVVVVVVVVNCFWLLGLYGLKWVLFGFRFVSLLPSWWWTFVVVLGWVVLLSS